MAANREIIKSAYVMAGVTDRMEEPAAELYSAGLEKLQDFIDGLDGYGIGRQLEDCSITTDVTAYDFERLLVAPAAAMTVTLPLDPQPGARVTVVDRALNFATYNVTVARNGRLLEGAAADQTLSSNGANRTWFYREDLGDWKRVTDLTDGGDHPFPSAFDGGLKAILATLLAPEHGREVSETVQGQARNCLDQLGARYLPLFKPRGDGVLLNTPGTAFRSRRGSWAW
jgi:hypothetical protein